MVTTNWRNTSYPKLKDCGRGRDRFRNGVQMVWMQPGSARKKWQRYYRALETYWLLYMRGRGTPEDAIASCTDEIGQIDHWFS